MLSDSDDAGDDITQLTINEHYAKAFEYRKEREELEQRTCCYLRLVILPTLTTFFYFIEK